MGAARKRPNSDAVAVAEQVWRTVKRRSCSPSQQQNLQQLQWQQPVAGNSTAATAHTVVSRVGCRHAAALGCAAAAAGADHAELCLQDSQPNQQQLAQAPVQPTTEQQQPPPPPPIAGARAHSSPAVVSAGTSSQKPYDQISNLIPYLDFIPSTEADAAAAAAGPIMFRDYVPATECPEGLQLQSEPLGSLGAEDTREASAADDGFPGVGPAASEASSPSGQLAVAGPGAIQQDTASARVNSGLVMFRDYIPATVFQESDVQQVVGENYGTVPSAAQTAQLAAAAATTTSVLDGLPASAAATPAAATTGLAGGLVVGMAVSGALHQRHSAAEAANCHISTGGTSAGDAGHDQQQYRQDDGWQHLPQQQQQEVLSVLGWRDAGETQPQPHALIHQQHPLPSVDTNQQHPEQEQTQPRQQDIHGALWLDDGVTQPQPGVHTEQWQQEHWQQQQQDHKQQQQQRLQRAPAIAICGGFEETESQPDAVLRQQQQQVSEEAVQSAAAAALQQSTAVRAAIRVEHDNVAGREASADLQQREVSNISALAAGKHRQSGEHAAASKINAAIVISDPRLPSPVVRPETTPKAAARHPEQAGFSESVSRLPASAAAATGGVSSIVSGKGSRAADVSAQWHVPARHRRWNVGHKPGSLAGCWSKAGLLGGSKVSR